MRKVLSNGCPQRIFTKENRSFQTFFFDRADERFCKCIQDGRTWWELHRVDSGFFEEAHELLRVERILVVNQISVRLQEAVVAIGDIPSDSLHSESDRTFCDSAELYALCRQLNEEQDHETLESVSGPDFDGERSPFIIFLLASIRELAINVAQRSSLPMLFLRPLLGDWKPVVSISQRVGHPQKEHDLAA
jgi:hypothetical protein